MSSSPAGQAAIDGTAVCLSALCLVHCLALPLVLSIAPWIVPGMVADERFHLWAVLLALPISVIGISRGVLGHRHTVVAALAGLGLLSLLAGALWVEGKNQEILFSVFGATVLAGAHLLNWRLSRGLRAA
ncbi:MAG: MerC domain-containing protein [Pseudomonadota bacterium]